MRIERLDGDDSSQVDLATTTESMAAERRHETRDRATYYEDLRAAVAADRREGLDSAVDSEVRQGCERIREAERSVITPAMREIEAADPERELVGLDHRLKGEERLKEKVTNMLRAQRDMTPDQALTAIPDAIRFTFCYDDERYASGVRADLERLHARGFEMTRPLKNYWGNDLYRGINTQWREPETGQRFEVQFHTPASFDAKQDTHGAYELLRKPDTPRARQREMEHFQREVCATVPVPSGAFEISDHPREKRDG